MFIAQSSLQIQRSVWLDEGTPLAHRLTPDCTYLEGFCQNYIHSVCFYSSLHSTNSQQLSLDSRHFSSLEVVLVLYKLIIPVFRFNAHATCTYSNACCCSYMIEPLFEYAIRFEITCTRRPFIFQGCTLNLSA